MPPGFSFLNDRSRLGTAHGGAVCGGRPGLSGSSGHLGKIFLDAGTKGRTGPAYPCRRFPISRAADPIGCSPRPDGLRPPPGASGPRTPEFLDTWTRRRNPRWHNEKRCPGCEACPDEWRDRPRRGWPESCHPRQKGASGADGRLTRRPVPGSLLRHREVSGSHQRHDVITGLS